MVPTWYWAQAQSARAQITQRVKMQAALLRNRIMRSTAIIALAITLPLTSRVKICPRLCSSQRITTLRCITAKGSKALLLQAVSPFGTVRQAVRRATTRRLAFRDPSARILRPRQRLAAVICSAISMQNWRVQTLWMVRSTELLWVS